jgi:uncharacterized protein
MKLEVATWPEGTTDKEVVEQPDDLDLKSDMNRFEEPVKVRLTVQKSDDEVIISGRLQARAVATCVRCLQEFPFAIDEELRRVANVVPDKQVGEDTGDPDFVFLPQSEPVWDLNEVFREIILLALTDDPVCREDCRGLCPGCGANLNTESCHCERAPSESPFAELSHLLKQRNSRTSSGNPD